jgi:tRNA and rRNA cytosine-C5-methylases
VERLRVMGSAGRDVAAFLHEHYPDEALDILTHTADGGLTSLRANPLKGTPEALCEKLLASGAKTAAPGLVPGSVLARFEGSPAESGLFRDGYFHVEGQASQLAALCVEAKPGDTVLDLCAAPGGKSLLLIEEMGDEGRLVSCDVSENRVQLIRKAVERMGFRNVEPRVSDGTKADNHLPMADAISVDAPCSGLGILARSRTSATRASKKRVPMNYWPPSSAILDTAAGPLEEGGRLVYSTCSIDPCEDGRARCGLRGATTGIPGVAAALRFPAGITCGLGALSSHRTP